MYNDTHPIVELDLDSFFQIYTDFATTDLNIDKTVQTIHAKGDNCEELKAIHEVLKILVTQNEILTTKCKEKSCNYLIMTSIVMITLAVNIFSICMMCISRGKHTECDMEQKSLEDNVKKLKSKL